MFIHHFWMSSFYKSRLTRLLGGNLNHPRGCYTGALVALPIFIHINDGRIYVSCGSRRATALF